MATKDRPVNTPPTTTMKFTDARAHLSEIFNRVAKEETRILVEKNGVPVGAIISARDLDRLKRFDQERAKEREELMAALKEVGESFKDAPQEELEREIASAIEESRIELRAEQAVAALGNVFKSAEEYNREYAKALAQAREEYRAETERANQA